MSKLSGIPKKDLVIVGGSPDNCSRLLKGLLARVDWISAAIIETTDTRKGNVGPYRPVSPKTFQAHASDYVAIGRNVYGNSGIMLSDASLSVAVLNPVTDKELFLAAIACDTTRERLQHVLWVYLNDPKNALDWWEEQNLKSMLHPFQDAQMPRLPSVNGPRAAVLEFDATKRTTDEITRWVAQYISMLTKRAA